MTDFNENITIDVKAKYDQLDGLQKKLMSVMDTLGSLGKGAPSSKLQNFWANSTNSIEEMTKSLDYAMKMVEKSQSKLREAQVGGLDSEIKDAETVVKYWQDRERAVVKAIIHSEQYKNTLEQITQEYQKQQDAENQNAQVQAKAQELAQNAQAYLQKFLLSLDPYQQKMAELNSEIAKACDEIVRLKSLDPEADVSQLEESVRQLKYEQEELKESTKQTASWWDKLLGRIKNIAIYRTIRRSMQIVVQLIKNGFNNVVKLSESASKMQQQLTADYNLISTALGATLYTLLKPLVPAIDSITDAFVGLINIVNRFISALSGSDKYLKVIRKDIKDTRKELGLLSFDKFESLSNNDKNEGVAGVDIQEVSLANDGLAKVFSTLGDIFEKLGGIKVIIIELVALGLVLKINKIATALGGMSTAMAGVTTAVLAFIASFFIVDSLLNGLSDTGKVVMGTILTIVGGIVAIYSAIQLIKHAWSGFGAIAIAAVSAGAALAGIKSVITGAKNMSGYENGGIPDKSELFYMNENGVPEALVNTGGNQTNVINIDQLSEGMRRGFVQAIYDTGLLTAMQQGSSTIMVDKDVLGRTVAESAGFRNEVNRRNVSLNLR